MLLKYLGKFLGACLAAPLNLGLVLLGGVTTYSLVFLSTCLLIPYLLTKMLHLILHDLVNFRLFSAISTSLFITPLTILLIPISWACFSVIAIGLNIISSPIEGAELGWNSIQDFSASFGSRFIQYMRAVEKVFEGIVNWEKQLMGTIGFFDRVSKAMGLIAVILDFSYYRYRPVSPSTIAHKRIAAAQKKQLKTPFTKLRLSQEEMDALVLEQQPPLTEQELVYLKEIQDVILSDGITKARSLSMKYHDLVTRLQDDCPILIEHPSRENTILLVKQYQKVPDGPWHIVPERCTIFDVKQLEHWYSLGKPHPKYREILIDKAPDGVLYKGCETRYRYHPLYLPTEASIDRLSHSSKSMPQSTCPSSPHDVITVQDSYPNVSNNRIPDSEKISQERNALVIQIRAELSLINTRNRASPVEKNQYFNTYAQSWFTLFYSAPTAPIDLEKENACFNFHP